MRQKFCFWLQTEATHNLPSGHQILSGNLSYFRPDSNECKVQCTKDKNARF